MTGKFGTLIQRMLGRAGTGSSLPGSLQAASGKPPPIEADENFSSEMFVQLLLELPAHRRDIAESWQAGDLLRLRSCVHRLLGATVYCDAPQLEAALRELRSALHSGDAAGIALQHARALDVIDTTLNCSGCR
jgi:HPt (histidine-containing phosphotransfer) domain-containing protein